MTYDIKTSENNQMLINNSRNEDPKMYHWQQSVK